MLQWITSTPSPPLPQLFKFFICSSYLRALFDRVKFFVAINSRNVCMYEFVCMYEYVCVNILPSPVFIFLLLYQEAYLVLIRGFFPPCCFFFSFNPWSFRRLSWLLFLKYKRGKYCVLDPCLNPSRHLVNMIACKRTEEILKGIWLLYSVSSRHFQSMLDVYILQQQYQLRFESQYSYTNALRTWKY